MRGGAKFGPGGELDQVVGEDAGVETRVSNGRQQR